MTLHLHCTALEVLAEALVPEVLAPADLWLVDTVAPRFGEDNPQVLLALALALRGPRHGHVGVNLREVAVWNPGVDVAEWEGRVGNSAMVVDATQTSASAKLTPFVRQQTPDGPLWMTQRMWQEQVRLAARLTQLAVDLPSAPPLEMIHAAMHLLPITGEVADAVLTAMTRRLTVVTGGPGTGKTTGLQALLAVLFALENQAHPLRVALAAPTGKAAARMGEALQTPASHLPGITVNAQEKLAALTPQTVHKLLGVRPDGTCRHDALRPLAVDLLVVDEVSMVDLVLMRQLLEAVPEGARVILLGDRDQLASVEVGTVLADIVAGAFQNPPPVSELGRSIVRLRQGRRFRAAPTLALVAAALQDDDPTRDVEAVATLCGRGARVPDESLADRVRALGAAQGGRPSAAQVSALAEPYISGYVQLLRTALLAGGDFSDAARVGILEALGNYRVLAVHREGPLGVAGLEKALGALVRASLAEHLREQGPYWLGQPLLVTENAYDLDLMNGDVGLVLPGAHGLSAFFLRRQGPVTVTQEVPLARLPANTGALAMTVHKSQGSQFAHVALVLADRDSPIQTRELVYTGLTRASTRLDWLGSEAQLVSALARRVTRASGLEALLWGDS